MTLDPCSSEPSTLVFYPRFFFSEQQELELSEAQLSDIVQEFENELRRILDRPPPEED